jgi:hypothetical protein
LLAALVGRNSSSHGRADRCSNVQLDDIAHKAVPTKSAPASIYGWTVISLSIAILFTAGYAGWKVITGYREHRNELAVFARNVREQAEAHRWRYEVVSAKDEGLLLYLQKTHFIEPDEAISEWNSGNLDALVASREKASALLDQLKFTDLSLLKSNGRRERRGKEGYMFITRSGPR